MEVDYNIKRRLEFTQRDNNIVIPFVVIKNMKEKGWKRKMCKLQFLKNKKWPTKNKFYFYFLLLKDIWIY